MENRGLLFIPDISGFTRFVHETEIEHSRMIVQELLEILINSNEIGLEISEIEGDAILFYKFGDAPQLEALYRQVEKMFCTFHKSIISYERQRYCQCKACLSISSLSLKVITHYGEFTGYNVKTFNKLIGKDIIVAHQLLKNEIANHEYWLVTETLATDKSLEGYATWMQWSSGAKETETGKVPFHYTELSQLRNTIKPEPLPAPDLSKTTKVLSASRDYDTDIITLFHATGGFHYRHRWQEGVKKVEELNHYLPRIGMKCRTIFENGEITTYSSSYRYQEDRIEFSETQEDGQRIIFYTLEKTPEKMTRLSIDHYIPGSLLGQLNFSLFRKSKEEDVLQKSMDNLVTLVKELHVPTAATR